MEQLYRIHKIAMSSWCSSKTSSCHWLAVCHWVK